MRHAVQGDRADAVAPTIGIVCGFRRFGVFRLVNACIPPIPAYNEDGAWQASTDVRSSMHCPPFDGIDSEERT
jgi:hypothetical protein